MNGLESDSDNERENIIFNDVKSNHWASGYINIAYKNGFLTYKEVSSGDTSIKYFNPDEVVTYEDAITWCVKSLGYNVDSYIEKAEKLKLLENLDCSYNKEATRGNIAILLWNTLNAESI